MGGRRAWEFGYSPHLPPVEAWKEPERWINLRTGLPLEDSEEIKLPVDDRGIILADKAIQLVKSTLFKDEYDWSNGTGRVRANVHHFYYDAEDYEPEHHGGSTVPRLFRQAAPLMGKVPVTFHNALHAFTPRLDMPSYEVMGEYNEYYSLAFEIFTNLLREAEGTRNASRDFALRQQSLATGRVEPKDPEDQIGQEILRDSFAKHFSRYIESVEIVRSLQEQRAIAFDMPDKAYRKPHVVARRMGQYGIKNYVTKGHINYLSEFNRAA